MTMIGHISREEVQQEQDAAGWTPEGRLTFGTGYWDIGEANARTLAITINASLKKERDITERNAALIITRNTKELRDEVQQLRTKLADLPEIERSREAWKNIAHEMTKKLAAAQATAKAHNDINGDICHIDLTDTSALDTAIQRALNKEDLMKRYHNEPRFHRFVQEMIAHSLAKIGGK